MTEKTFDLVGIGFGPANLSVAIALRESSHLSSDNNHVFFDDRSGPDWHPGLMFPEATMQISFLKDLVTMVNPKSEFTFLNYLVEQGRIHEFINLRTFYPRRIEFEDYIKWATDKLSDSVRYKTKVTDVRLSNNDSPATSDLLVDFECTDSGKQGRVRTKSLILADGGAAKWPIATPRDSLNRIFHSADTLPKLSALSLPHDGPHRFHIVGSGQSSADIFDYISGQYPNSEITLSFRSYAMRPEDDSHFVNELFMPHTVDLFNGLTADWRDRIIKDYWHVTHNGVTLDLIPKLYQKVYYDRAQNRNLYQFNRFSELVSADEDNGQVTLCLRNITSGQQTTAKADVLILAVGYERPCQHPLLANLGHMLLKDEARGIYQLDRDYRVKTAKTCAFNVFLQGYGERSHGFSESLLSLMPERAARIVQRIADADLQRGESAA